MTVKSKVLKKYYLLAGVLMTANMCIVNEVRAAETNEELKDNNDFKQDGKTNDKDEIINLGPCCKYIGIFLNWENTVNLVGGALFTLANSLYNFYEKKPSFYFDGWFAGWNSKFFAKGYLQFCPNINLGRGVFWVFVLCIQTYLLKPYVSELYKNLVKMGIDENRALTLGWKFMQPYCEYTPHVIKLACKVNEEKLSSVCTFFRLLQALVSIPIIINFTSRVSISIALDSIIWMIVTCFVDKGEWGKGVSEATNEIKNKMSEI